MLKALCGVAVLWAGVYLCLMEKTGKDPDRLGVFVCATVFGVGMVSGLVWSVRDLLGKFGWKGPAVRFILLIDGVFLMLLIGTHQNPWSPNFNFPASDDLALQSMGFIVVWFLLTASDRVTRWLLVYAQRWVFSSLIYLVLLIGILAIFSSSPVGHNIVVNGFVYVFLPLVLILDLLNGIWRWWDKERRLRKAFEYDPENVHGNAGKASADDARKRGWL